MASHSTTITLPPVLSELPALSAAIEAFCEEQNVPMPDNMALALAAEELFTNTVNHGGCSSPACSTSLTLTREPETILFVYSDCGKAFDTATASTGVNTTLSAAERPIGGLGLHMIAKTMESFRYERNGDRNVTTLVRRLGAKKLAI